jgi:hypothetical protein
MYTSQPSTEILITLCSVFGSLYSFSRLFLPFVLISLLSEILLHLKIHSLKLVWYLGKVYKEMRVCRVINDLNTAKNMLLSGFDLLLEDVINYKSKRADWPSKSVRNFILFR